MGINVISKHRDGGEAENLRLDIAKAMSEQKTKPNRYEVWRVESFNTAKIRVDTSFVYDRLDIDSIYTVRDETGKVLGYRLKPTITARAKGPLRFDEMRREISDKLTAKNPFWQNDINEDIFDDGVYIDNNIYVDWQMQSVLVDNNITIDAFQFKKQPPDFMQLLLYSRCGEWFEQHREAYRKMRQYYGDGDNQEARFVVFYALAPHCIRLHLFDRCNPDYVLVRHSPLDQERKKAYWTKSIMCCGVNTTRPDKVEELARESILSRYKAERFMPDEYGAFNPEDAKIELIPANSNLPCLFDDDDVILELDTVNSNMDFPCI